MFKKLQVVCYVQCMSRLHTCCLFVSCLGYNVRRSLWGYIIITIVFVAYLNTLLIMNLWYVYTNLYEDRFILSSTTEPLGSSRLAEYNVVIIHL